MTSVGATRPAEFTAALAALSEIQGLGPYRDRRVADDEVAESDTAA